MCWTGSTSSDGSRPGSPRSAATSSAESPTASSPAFDPEVFRARFALLRRGDTLTDTDRARLDKLFDAHPRLKAGWQALQELHGLYTADDYDGALEALGRFCDLYETGELPEYHDTHPTDPRRDTRFTEFWRFLPDRKGEVDHQAGRMLQRGAFPQLGGCWFGS